MNHATTFNFGHRGPPPAQNRKRHAAADRFSEDRQIGRKSVVALSTGCPETKTSDRLIGDHQHSLLVATFPDGFDHPWNCLHTAGIAKNGLESHGRELPTILFN